MAKASVSRVGFLAIPSSRMPTPLQVSAHVAESVCADPGEEAGIGEAGDMVPHIRDRCREVGGRQLVDAGMDRAQRLDDRLDDARRPLRGRHRSGNGRRRRGPRSPPRSTAARRHCGSGCPARRRSRRCTTRIRDCTCPFTSCNFVRSSRRWSRRFARVSRFGIAAVGERRPSSTRTVRRAVASRRIATESPSSTRAG